MYRKSQSSNAVSTGAVGIKGVSPVGQSSEAAVLVMERAGDSLAFHSTPPFQPSLPLRPEHQGALSVVNGSENISPQTSPGRR